MLSLSAAAIVEKNSISTDGVFLVLLEIVLTTPATTLRLVRNTDDITWRGNTWSAFPFDLDDVSEDGKGELPSVTIRVSNVTRIIQYYLEQGNGGVGATVTLFVVHSKNLASTTAELEESFEITDSSADAQWVTFSLGAGYPLMARRPEKRMLKNFCPFEYGSIECGVSAAEKLDHATCQKTLLQCRDRANSARYGGEPSIPGGLYV